MNNNTKRIAVGCAVTCGIAIIAAISVAVTHNNRQGQIETTTRVEMTTAKTTGQTEDATETTTDTTKISDDEIEEVIPSEKVTKETSLPEEVIPESEVVYTTEPNRDNNTEPTNATEKTTTTTSQTEQIPETTTEIDPNNIEGATWLSRDYVEECISANFDFSEPYNLEVRENGAFYLNGRVVVFSSNKPIGEYMETSLGEGIVVSPWYDVGYVIVMDIIDG